MLRVEQSTCNTASALLQGGVTDSQTVLFSTSSTQYNSPPVQSNATASPPAKAPSSTTTASVCTSKCIKAVDIVCFLRHRCWKLLGHFTALFSTSLLLGKAQLFIWLLSGLMAGLSEIKTQHAGMLLWIGLIRGWWWLLFSRCLALLCHGTRSKKGADRVPASSRDASPTPSTESSGSQKPLRRPSKSK